MPSRSSSASSAGKRARPLASPWVRLAAQKPPLRPDAAHPMARPSSSTTSAAGSRSLASRAVHSPVNPPPITASPAAVARFSGGSGGGLPGWSSQ